MGSHKKHLILRDLFWREKDFFPFAPTGSILANQGIYLCRDPLIFSSHSSPHLTIFSTHMTFLC